MKIERIANSKLREVGACQSLASASIHVVLGSNMSSSSLRAAAMPAQRTKLQPCCLPAHLTAPPQAVFRRRKNGLLRRAMELSVLADCDVALLIFHGNTGEPPAAAALDQLLTANAAFGRHPGLPDSSVG